MSGLKPAIVLAPFIALMVLRPLLPEWALVWPGAWAVPFVDWINAVVEVLKKEPIFYWFTFKEFTRAIATVVEWPLDFMMALLISGFKPLGLPAMPWVMVVGLAAVFGWWIKGWRLALLAGGCIFYIARAGLVVQIARPDHRPRSLCRPAGAAAGPSGLGPDSDSFDV